jgi:thiosulfate dehydrogenase [quinone] large subunit
MSQPLADRVRDPGWVLLPLRAFLAIVFLDAGISKFADRRYLDSSSFMSIHSQISAVKSASPVGGLLGPVVDHSFAFGIFTGIAEIAVGIGIALGLFTRVAAVGGMLLSLSLWLTISWNASPWFTSADVVYLFAFTPLLLAGAGGVWSADAWLAQAGSAHPGRSEDRTRRVIIGFGGAVAVAVLAGGGTLFRRSAGKTPTAAGSTGSSATSGSSAAPASADPSSGSAGSGGVVLTATSAVPVGGAKAVKSGGKPAYVLQLEAGRFTALSAVCTHQGCTVSFDSASKGFDCPCHGSRYDSAGKVLNGPATAPLPTIAVTVDGSDVRAT